MIRIRGMDNVMNIYQNIQSKNIVRNIFHFQNNFSGDFDRPEGIIENSQLINVK